MRGDTPGADPILNLFGAVVRWLGAYNCVIAGPGDEPTVADSQLLMAATFDLVHAASAMFERRPT